MFDARSIIESMMRGAASRNAPAGGQAPSGGLGGIGDLLNQLGQGRSGGQSGSGSDGGLGGLGDILGQLTQGRGSQSSTGGQSGGAPGGFSLEDLIRNLGAEPSEPRKTHGDPRTGGDADRGGFGGQMPRNLTPDTNAPSGPSSGGLGDILGQLQKQLGGGRDGQATGGGLLEQLGEILKQGADGAREGAGRISDATGAGQAFEKMSGGRSPNDILQQLQDLIANNKLGAGAALGGLGALVLGTQTGRSVAMSAAKIGALALIGGLAYKAYQNYAQGQSPGATGPVEAEPAPRGSGFEASDVSDQAAITYLRAMISAAAADGRLDAQEQEKITANLTQAGLGQEAEEFIAREISNPASVDDLADSVADQREAIQLYTAARIAIEPDTHAEQQFLAALAHQLDIDENLARHIDASARNLRVG